MYYVLSILGLLVCYKYKDVVEMSLPFIHSSLWHTWRDLSTPGQNELARLMDEAIAVDKLMCIIFSHGIFFFIIIHDFVYESLDRAEL